MFETKMTSAELDELFNGRAPFFEVEERNGYDGWAVFYDRAELDAPVQTVLSFVNDRDYWVCVRNADGTEQSGESFENVWDAYNAYKRQAAETTGGVFGSYLN